MIIKTDEEANALIGQQIYTIKDNQLMPMIANNVILTKTFSGIGMTEVKAKIVTALGTFSVDEIYKNKEELIAYIDKVIDS